ncbi:hypothetical protein V6N13_072150 [Hibiscus sabdariffa]|uniref:Uncharacterized protein n=1 Tax=Hibiscus sabdariffa TaxID=183260 RepID=A0ABR2TC61_9ROSI
MTRNVLVLDGQKPVASKNSVIHAIFTLNQDKHVAVHIVEKGTNQVLRDNNGRVLPSSILGFNKNTTSIKGVQRNGLKTKKHDKRESTKPAMAVCILSLVTELDKAKVEALRQTMEHKLPMSAPATHVQWHANTTFEYPNRLDMHV